MLVKKDEPLLLCTGNYLGELTNEIEDGWEMQSFVGLGAKNYCYAMKNLVTGEVKYVYKVRGITLNYRAKEQINYEHYYNLVTEKYDSRQIFSPNNILRKAGYKIVSKGQYKTHRMVNNKRRKLNPSNKEDYSTLPYGYCSE